MKHLLTLLALACTLTLVGCGDSTPGPGDTVREFAYAMEDGDAEKVKELCPGLVAVMGTDKVDDVVAEAAADASKEGGIKSITIDEEVIDGKTAQVIATVENAKGEKETQGFELALVNDKWVITLSTGGKEPGGDGSDVEIDLDAGGEQPGAE